MIKFIPATSDMLALVAGEIPAKTVRAIAVVDGDAVLGVGGFYFDTDKAVIFSYITDALRKRPIALVKASRIVMRWVAKLSAPVCASCDSSIEASARFLKHLGFEHVGKDIWLLPE